MGAKWILRVAVPRLMEWRTRIWRRTGYYASAIYYQWPRIWRIYHSVVGSRCIRIYFWLLRQFDSRSQWSQSAVWDVLFARHVYLSYGGCAVDERSQRQWGGVFLSGWRAPEMWSSFLCRG